MSRFHALTVAAVRPDARDCVVVDLAVPAALAATFAFRPGQHLTLRADVDGEDLSRPYSICAAPRDGVLRVAIKRCTGGRFSGWAQRSLHAGDVLRVLPPAGHFGDLPGEHPDAPTPVALQASVPAPVAPQAPVPVPVRVPSPAPASVSDRAAAAPDRAGRPAAAPRRYLGIAAGSGITPVYAVLRARLQHEPGSSATLICGNRATASVVLRDALAALKDEYPARLALVHVLSREPQDIELFNGRLTRAKCDELFARWVRVADHDAAFVCGPEPVIEAAGAALRAAGMAASMIRSERFASAGAGATPTPRMSPPLDPAAAGSEIVVVVDGRRQRFAMARGAATVLDAGLAHGIDLRHACKSGVCATCRCKLVEGRVEMDAHPALEDYEVARGFVLACRARPVTPRVVLDFDRDH